MYLTAKGYADMTFWQIYPRWIYLEVNGSFCVLLIIHFMKFYLFFAMFVLIILA